MPEKKGTAHKVRAKLIELYKRYTPFAKKEGVYHNGHDDNYDAEIERVISNSPTAKRSALMLSKYISGAGVTDDTVVNFRKNLKKSDIVKEIADDVSVQYGCYIHRSFKIDIQSGKVVPDSLKVLDYLKCRKAKCDDQENEGKIKIVDKEQKKKTGARNGKKADNSWYYPFSNDQKVILAQIKSDAKSADISTEEDRTLDLEEALPHYRGQVFYLNLTPKYIYAVSLFDAVYNDCDTEYRIGLYTNSMSRTGFLGKTAVITAGLDDDEQEQIDKDVEGWLGAEDANNVYRFSVEEAEDIDKVLKIVQVKSQFDEKQFKDTKLTARMNILGAANNIPEGLVYNSQSVFGNSGEALENLKRIFTEQTEYERNEVEKTMNLLGFPCSIIPLIEENVLEVDAGDDIAKAQATLRGSVGGVQGVLDIQRSVTEGATDLESAIAILVNIYGFTEQVARDILGEPRDQPDLRLMRKKLIKDYSYSKRQARKILKALKK